MKPKIMIVDDAIFMRAVLKDVLENNGYEVVGSASNGEKGVKLFENLSASGLVPDLILLDITMKKMNGIEALKEIRKRNKDVRVVMCSSVKAKEALVEAIQAGATYFLTKPFEDEELLEVVKKALGKK